MKRSSPRASVRARHLLAWHAAAAVLLFVLPSLIVLKEAVWRLGADRMPAAAGLAVCYLAGGVLLTALPHRRRWTGLLRSAVVLAAALSVYFLALLLVPDIWYSRPLVLGGTVLAGLLGMAPVLLPPRSLVPVAGVLLVAAAGSAAVLQMRGAVPEPVRTASVLLTSHGTVTLVHHTSLMPRPSNGGGISVYGDGYIVATGDGDLYRLRWHDGDSLAAVALPYHVPLNRDAFAADAPEDVAPDWFRVAHVLLRGRADSLQVIASHHHWNVADQCFTMRVSALTVAASVLDSGMSTAHTGPAGESWTTLYETRPCLRFKHHERGFTFAGPHMGGRLADPGDGRLFVTAGDHQFDGWASDEQLPQDPAADYGKVLVLHANGQAERLTSGHRNPQGLHIDAAGRIWTTEHGPQGGDALHEIVPGANYGWPYFTYGTDYGSAVWPLQGQGDLPPDSVRHAVYAWVPSIGVSNLIEVRRFPLQEWRGDLLVASLDGRSLYRLRRDGGRVIYAEPIRIGARIRDLVEDAEGRIVLWLDGGEIMTLSAGPVQQGAALFARCAGCHSVEPGAAAGIGPNLQRVFGRRIAAEPDFTYSPALQSLAGRWTAQNLDAFLAGPQLVAPGTTMDAEPMHDATERAALIEYLQSIR